MPNRPLEVFSRVLSISALVASLFNGSLELVSQTPFASVTPVRAASVSQSELFSANELISRYGCNLGDDGPLLVSSAQPGAISSEARLAESKHIPINAIRPVYTDAMAASDSRLASIFGGPGAVAAANGFEPRALGSQYPLYRGDLISDDGRILRGHLSFAMHLYGSSDGTQETELYVPQGFVSNSSEPTPTDAAITFYYPNLGSLADVTLAVFHIANFQLSYEDGRVRVGNIGGRGGSVGSYRHSHIEFYRGNTGLPPASARVRLRIDPVTVFRSEGRSIAGSVWRQELEIRRGCVCHSGEGSAKQNGREIAPVLDLAFSA